MGGPSTFTAFNGYLHRTLAQQTALSISRVKKDKQGYPLYKQHTQPYRDTPSFITNRASPILHFCRRQRILKEREPFHASAFKPQLKYKSGLGFFGWVIQCICMLDPSCSYLSLVLRYRPILRNIKNNNNWLALHLNGMCWMLSKSKSLSANVCPLLRCKKREKVNKRKPEGICCNCLSETSLIRQIGQGKRG